MHLKRHFFFSFMNRLKCSKTLDFFNSNQIGINRILNSRKNPKKGIKVQKSIKTL